MTKKTDNKEDPKTACAVPQSILHIRLTQTMGTNSGWVLSHDSRGTLCISEVEHALHFCSLEAAQAFLTAMDSHIKGDVYEIVANATVGKYESVLFTYKPDGATPVLAITFDQDTEDWEVLLQDIAAQHAERIAAFAKRAKKNGWDRPAQDQAFSMASVASHFVHAKSPGRYGYNDAVRADTALLFLRRLGVSINEIRDQMRLNTPKAIVPMTAAELSEATAGVVTLLNKVDSAKKTSIYAKLEKLLRKTQLAGEALTLMLSAPTATKLAHLRECGMSLEALLREIPLKAAKSSDA